MKKITLIIIAFLMGLIIGIMVKSKNNIIECNNSKGKLISKVEVNQIQKTGISKQQLIDSLIKYGDTILYEKLRWQYDTSMIDFLGIALIMANKYNYSNAYEDVFESFHSVLKSGKYYDTRFNYSIYDDKTKKIAQEYLEEAVKRNNRNAIEIKCMYDRNCNYEKLIDSLMVK